MYARILVAVDGSPKSEHALRHAVGLAARCSAALRIVHVVDMGWLVAGPELAIDTERFAKARRAAGEQVLADAGALARGAGLEAGTRLLETETPNQNIASVIAHEAEQWQAEIVVVGTHGRKGIDRLLLGSVAERVARLSNVPVLLVR